MNSRSPWRPNVYTKEKRKGASGAGWKGRNWILRERTLMKLTERYSRHEYETRRRDSPLVPVCEIKIFPCRYKYIYVYTFIYRKTRERGTQKQNAKVTIYATTLRFSACRYPKTVDNERTYRAKQSSWFTRGKITRKKIKMWKIYS